VPEWSEVGCATGSYEPDADEGDEGDEGSGGGDWDCTEESACCKVCTDFENNSGYAFGGAVYAADGISSLTVFRFNDVYGNTGGDYGGDYSDHTGMGGNISLDPGVVDYSNDGDETNDDLTLTPTSPCIDAGTPHLDDPDDSRSDMGAYGGPGA
jgi:predicted outer membrane repeat protein